MRAGQLGSLPGTDYPAAIRLLREDLPEWFTIPELPGRGPSAGMVARAIGTLDGLAVERQPGGWRLTDHPGRDQRRARALLRDDLDRVEEHLLGQDALPPGVTLTLCGPWTLAAAIELPRGELVLADPGARRELAQSLAQGSSDLVAELGRRFAPSPIHLQLDEPGLPAVAAGTLRTASGFSRHQAIEPEELVRLLAHVVGAQPEAAQLALHCCAPGLDLDWLARAKITTVALDVSLIDSAQFEQLGAWLEAGNTVAWGLLDATASAERADQASSVDTLIASYRQLVRTLALDPELVARQSILTPSCGLAGWAVPQVPLALRGLARAAERALEATS